MNNRNEFNELERELNSFPTLKLDENKQNIIHQNLMVEASKLDSENKKGAIMKRMTVGFSSIAVVVLCVFLAFSMKDSSQLGTGDDGEEINPGTVQGEPELVPDQNPFASVLERDVSKIVATTDHITGNGTTYKTNHSDIIQVFTDNILSMKFVETDETSSVFKTEYELFDSNNEEILTMVFTGKNIVTVNGIHYKIDESKLNSFEDIFFTNENKIEEEPTKTEETVVQEQAQNLIKALAERDTDLLAEYVHPIKGLLFSPYIFIHEDALVFNQDQVRDLLSNPDTFVWGTADGSGMPLEMTAEEYYAQYVYDSDFVNAEILVDSEKQRGNTINNIKEVFPDSHVVEFYIKGSEEYGGMDWKSLNLVFHQDGAGDWKLVAIVHDQWTI